MDGIFPAREFFLMVLVLLVPFFNSHLLSTSSFLFFFFSFLVEHGSIEASERVPARQSCLNSKTFMTRMTMAREGDWRRIITITHTFFLSL